MGVKAGTVKCEAGDKCALFLRLENSKPCVHSKPHRYSATFRCYEPCDAEGIPFPGATCSACEEEHEEQ